jgi:hypothetical protein
MSRRILKPAPGLLIPNPETARDLDAAGESVTDSPYWRRLIRAGEVVEVETVDPPPARVKTAAPASQE